MGLNITVKKTLGFLCLVNAVTTTSFAFTLPSSSRSFISNSFRRLNGDLSKHFMGSNGGGNNNFEDPNPGGMRQDDDPNQGRNRSDENFLETLKAWMNSDEGKDDIKTYTTSLVLALLLRLTIIEPRYIPSLSMYPTFEIGDQLAVEKVSKRIRPFDRNEVVVFNPPASFRQIIENNYGGSSKKSKEALIKRIVAVEVSIISSMFYSMEVTDTNESIIITFRETK